MFAPTPKDQEKQALDRARTRLSSRFSRRSPSEVRGVVDSVAHRFDDARVRDFVPVLVERISRDELNHRFAVR